LLSLSCRVLTIFGYRGSNPMYCLLLLSLSISLFFPSVRRLFNTPWSHRNICQYRNIDLLSIDFYVRIRLRTRLTLIRLALIRKP